MKLSNVSFEQEAGRLFVLVFHFAQVSKLPGPETNDYVDRSNGAPLMTEVRLKS